MHYFVIIIACTALYFHSLYLEVQDELKNVYSHSGMCCSSKYQQRP